MEVKYPDLMDYSTFKEADPAVETAISNETSLRDPGGGYANPARTLDDEILTNGTNAIYNPPPPASRPHKDPYGNDDNGCCGSIADEWNDRTYAERFLILLLLLVILIAAGIIITFIVIAKNGYGFPPGIFESKRIVCETPDCVVAAGEILRSLDTTVSPCDNFHQYTCGGWKVQNPIPEYYYTWNTFSVAEESLHFQLKTMLEEEPAPENEPRPIENLRKAYNACINEWHWEQVGLEPFMNLLQSFGGIPFLDPNYDESSFDWKQVVADMRRQYFVSQLIGVFVELNVNNNSEYIIYLEEGGYPVSKELLVRNDTWAREWMMNVMGNTALSIRSFLKTKSTSSSPESPLTNLSQNDSSKRNEYQRKYNFVRMPSILEGKDNYNQSEGTNEQRFISRPQIKWQPGLFEPKRFVDFGLRSKKKEYNFFDVDTLRKLLEMIKLLRIEQEIKNVWDFFVVLAQLASITKDEESNLEPITIAELQDFTDPRKEKIDWVDFLQRFFIDSKIVIDETTRLIAPDLNYLQYLLVFLDLNPVSLTGNALLMQLALLLGNDVTEPTAAFAEERNSYETSFGRSEARPWIDCTNKLNVLMGPAMTAAYIRTDIDGFKEDKKAAEELTDILQRSLVETLKKDSWMDTETQWAAVKKAKEMLSYVAFTNSLLNDTELTQMYKNLPEFGETDHFGNMKTLLQFHSSLSLSKLSLTPSRHKDSESPGGMNINAYYVPFSNTIRIPLGILRAPFYRKNTIKPLFFGAIGAIVSHELLHGFDVNGMEHNWKGELQNWWSNASLEKYLEKAECFEQSYGLLPITESIKTENGTELKVNGENTIGENIADVGGLHLSWAAFQGERLKNEDVGLVGLTDYTPEQLFFIAYGQVFCGSFSKTGLLLALTNSVHTPSPFRVNGAVRNHPDFGRTFGCQAPSLMISNTTCNLWL